MIIGGAVDLEGPSLYKRVDCKQEILRTIDFGILDHLLTDHEAAVFATRLFYEQLRCVMEAHILYAVSRRREILLDDREVLRLEV